MQSRGDGGQIVALPGSLVPRLADAGLLDGPEINTVLAIWRTPERLMASPSWSAGAGRLVDVLAFGESAVWGVQRSIDGLPRALPLGAVPTPQTAEGEVGAAPVIEFIRTEAGTLALRSAMVPQHAFPPGAEHAPTACLRLDASGFVDTGYACRQDRHAGTLTVTAPPPGLVSLGGYRFALQDLTDVVHRIDRDANVAVLPDALAGQRLAGQTANFKKMCAALETEGANALLVAAFRERSEARAA
jgi:hypothetical protein